jgi:tetratricopeptide (TPR) repeat protein
MKSEPSPKLYTVWGFVFWMISFMALGVTISWSILLGAGNLERASLAFTLCSASFATGTVLGFMFTIFGDEQEPFGKIRDAMIALASGITGVGLAKASEFGGLLGRVHIFANDSDRSSSFSILLVVTYFVAGFFFMYFFRKLALNPALAEAGNAMARIKNSGDVGVVAARITEKLSQGLLLGRVVIEEVEDLEPEEAERLRKDIFASDVNQFLEACESDVRGLLYILPENVAMAARLHYYRVYFEKEGTDARDAQEMKALDWIQRALMRDPLNIEFQTKLADIFGMQGRYDEAVSIIERLERDDNSPQYIQQWLGYYLLFIDGRERDAINHSLKFHDRFPDESSGLFNAACGYAQLYTIEIRGLGVDELTASTNRIESLRLLQQGIHAESDLKALARKHTEEGDSFESLATDPDFLKLTDEPASK